MMGNLSITKSKALKHLNCKKRKIGKTCMTKVTFVKVSVQLNFEDFWINILPCKEFCLPK